MPTAMLPADHAHPYPDYVACPHCGEPEVEVWCNVTTATCHACGREFEHALPAECGTVCSLSGSQFEAERASTPAHPAAWEPPLPSMPTLKPESAQDETTLT